MGDKSFSPKTIKVKLEVELPMGYSAPVTITVGEPSLSIDPKIDLPQIDNLGIGYLPPDPAQVKVVGSGLSGGICANGRDPYEPSLGYCTNVGLLVQSPNDPVPDTPSSGAVFVVPDNIGYWEYNGVPGAVCAWPGTGVELPLNLLVTWKKWSEEPDWYVNTFEFHGKCSDATDCDNTEGMIGQSAEARTVRDSSPGVIDTVPGSWKVSVSGFGGDGVTVFNGTWILVQYQQTAPGHLAWVAGGDSVQQPRVELFGQACGCSPFELRFSSRGSVVSYRFARDSWNPVGVNQSGTVISSGLPIGVEIPGQVTVVPG